MELDMKQQLERVFDRVVILCRETAGGMNWSEALSVLRVWEYTGRVRRGYFIEGLSGIQFIREKDFNGTMAVLEQSGNQLVWLPASDPSQPWGKYLPHSKDRAFLNVAGTAVALKGGMPVMVFERQGKVLRVFEAADLDESLQAFVQDFNGKRLYQTLNRLVVKQYPAFAAPALSAAGFIREMQDYVLYRK
jgi:ATP-dependent Lhr-like helicase